MTLEALGFELSKKDILKLMKEYDPSETGKIEYTDFVDLSIVNSDFSLRNTRSYGRN